MSSRERAWRDFVRDFDVDVPEEAVQAEQEYLRLAMLHNMQYDRLTGGGPHVFPARELEQQADELRAEAEFAAKEALVTAAVIEAQGLAATPDELAAEAAAIAQRQNATLDMVRMMFGDDFSGLEHDVLARKAVDWACGGAGGLA